MLPDIRKAVLDLTLPRLHPLALLVRAVLRRHCIEGIGGMIQDNRLSRTETSSSATLSTINLNQNVPRLNQDLRGERTGLSAWSMARPFTDCILYRIYMYKYSVPTSKRTEYASINRRGAISLF